MNEEFKRFTCPAKNCHKKYKTIEIARKHFKNKHNDLDIKDYIFLNDNTINKIIESDFNSYKRDLYHYMSEYENLKKENDQKTEIINQKIKIIDQKKEIIKSLNKKITNIDNEKLIINETKNELVTKTEKYSSEIFCLKKEIEKLNKKLEFFKDYTYNSINLDDVSNETKILLESTEIGINKVITLLKENEEKHDYADEVKETVEFINDKMCKDLAILSNITYTNLERKDKEIVKLEIKIAKLEKELLEIKKDSNERYALSSIISELKNDALKATRKCAILEEKLNKIGGQEN